MHTLALTKHHIQEAKTEVTLNPDRAQSNQILRRSTGHCLAGPQIAI